MNRHPFRWESLAFGLLFLTVVGTWAAWKSGLLDSGELVYAPAATLIVLGVAGIIASFASPRKAAATPEATDAESTDSFETDTFEEVRDDVEETDPQS